MSAPFIPTPVQQFPRLGRRTTAEDRFWSRLKHPVIVKEFAAVTAIDFSPVAPHDLAVSSSTRVQIYSSDKCTPKKSITRFKDLAYSGSFRHDGQLLVAGGEAGLIQVFDTNSRAVLRRFESHTGPVHVTRFACNGLHVFSGSDDQTVRYWDMAQEREVSCWDDGHTDFVRCGAVSATEPHLFLSGGYDHAVHLWDARAGKKVRTVQHGAPVEAVVFFPSSSTFASAGGTTVKIWEALGRLTPLVTLANHQKTITSLSFDGEHRRLLSGSLDHHVKVYDLASYQVVHSFKYTAPVLSVAVSPLNNLLAVGLVSGYLSLRHRDDTLAVEEKRLDDILKRPIRGGTYRHFLRGQNHKAQVVDFVVETSRRGKLRLYDKLLKKFKYHEALDAVFQGEHQPVLVTSFLQELLRRSALRLALRERDDEALTPVLSFVVTHITNPRYTRLLIDVGNVIIDMFAAHMGQSPKVDELFVKLQRKLQAEIEFQERLHQLIGCLDMLLAANPNS